MSEEQKPESYPSNSDEATDLHLHAWLDGELGPEEALALEDRLKSDPVLRHRVAMLRDMESWMREEISPPPQDLVDRVTREIEGQPLEVRSWRILPAILRAFSPRPKRYRVPTDRAQTWWDGLWGNRKQIWQVWTPLVGVLAVAVVLLLRSGPGGRPAPAPPPSTGTQARAARLEFRLEAPDARTVCLVGDFNHWKVCDTPLTHVDGNVWRTEVELPPGRHEYMFVVDGEWVTDPRASQYADDGFGNRNALVFL